MTSIHYDPWKGNPMDENRPNPLGSAAKTVAAVWAIAGGIVSALVAFGVLSAEQGQALDQLGQAAPGALVVAGTLIAGIAPLLASIGAAFHVAAKAKPDVTPVADPRDNFGRPLLVSPGPLDHGSIA